MKDCVFCSLVNRFGYYPQSSIVSQWLTKQTYKVPAKPGSYFRNIVIFFAEIKVLAKPGSYFRNIVIFFAEIKVLAKPGFIFGINTFLCRNQGSLIINCGEGSKRKNPYKQRGFCLYPRQDSNFCLAYICEHLSK